MAPVDDIPSVPVTDFDDQSMFLRPARGEILRVGILGAALGLFIPILGFLLSQFFLKPVFCSTGDVLGLCTNNTAIGYYVASVMFGAIAIVALANWQVFRPLVIAVAAVAALWGLKKYVDHIVGANAFEYYLFSVGLYAAAFILFYWLMRVRQFVLSLALTIAMVLVVRFAMLV